MSLPPRRASLIAILVAGAFFMENLDGTVIATALPQMGQSFHVSPVDLNMGMTAYMLMLAVFIPISGWVADRFGGSRKPGQDKALPMGARRVGNPPGPTSRKEIWGERVDRPDQHLIVASGGIAIPVKRSFQ